MIIDRANLASVYLGVYFIERDTYLIFLKNEYR
jgi:hypothetical protein